jgi:hypothetical protein
MKAKTAFESGNSPPKISESGAPIQTRRHSVGRRPGAPSGLQAKKTTPVVREFRLVAARGGIPSFRGLSTQSRNVRFFAK